MDIITEKYQDINLIDKDELASYLNNQLEYHKKQSEIHRLNEKKSKRHEFAYKQLKSLKLILEFILILPDSIETDTIIKTITDNSNTQNTDGETQNTEDDLFSLTFSESEELPDILKEDFVKNKTHQFTNQILELLKIANRPLHIGELQIALYKKFGIESKRTNLSNKLHRICKNEDSVNRVEGRKGYYELIN